MKRTLAFVVLAAFVGCGDSKKPEADETPVATTTADTAEPTAASKKKARKPRPPKKLRWKVSYGGELAGNVGGSIIAITGTGNTTSIAGGEAGRDGKAPQALFVMLFAPREVGSGLRAKTSLTLADGTKCADLRTTADSFSKMDVTDAGKKTFQATIKGELHCGEKQDKTIEYEAHLDERRK